MSSERLHGWLDDNLVWFSYVQGRTCCVLDGLMLPSFMAHKKHVAQFKLVGYGAQTSSVRLQLLIYEKGQGLFSWNSCWYDLMTVCMRNKILKIFCSSYVFCAYLTLDRCRTVLEIVSSRQHVTYLPPHLHPTCGILYVIWHEKVEGTYDIFCLIYSSYMVTLLGELASSKFLWNDLVGFKPHVCRLASIPVVCLFSQRTFCAVLENWLVTNCIMSACRTGLYAGSDFYQLKMSRKIQTCIEWII